MSGVIPPHTQGAPHTCTCNSIMSSECKEEDVSSEWCDLTTYTSFTSPAIIS